MYDKSLILCVSLCFYFKLLVILLFALKSKDCNCLSVIERGTNYNSYKSVCGTAQHYQLPGKVNARHFCYLADIDRSLFCLEERTSSF